MENPTEYKGLTLLFVGQLSGLLTQGGHAREYLFLALPTGALRPWGGEYGHMPRHTIYEKSMTSNVLQKQHCVSSSLRKQLVPCQTLSCR